MTRLREILKEQSTHSAVLLLAILMMQIYNSDLFSRLRDMSLADLTERVNGLNALLLAVLALAGTASGVVKIIRRDDTVVPPHSIVATPPIEPAAANLIAAAAATQLRTEGKD